MANNNNEGADNNPDNSKDIGSEKSFVGKFVSGIINSTPLSKWFGKDSPSRSIIRRRDEDEEFDTSYNFQPPSKRAKLPAETESNSYSAHVFESPVTVHASNNVNKVFGKFPEPVPGPSGIKSRKLFDRHNTASTATVSAESFDNQFEVVNGENDSDSGESTSGYSSAPKLAKLHSEEEHKKEDEKLVSKPRSLFTSNNSSTRTLFPERCSQMNTSLSSRRPAFNASTFGSPNFVDRTLSTKRIMNSPFYSGRTMYGGASAYGRKLGKNADEITSVQIKPVNDKLTNENTTLSKTARRILSTLEQYSTPISDAKKIPVSPRKSGLISTYVGATPYLVRDRKRPSNKELQVPSVPDLLQMKQKQRLQNSTEQVRQIATKSKSNLNKEEYKLRTEEDNKQRHSNKMKSSVASVRQKVQPIEPVSEVKLPKVSLPITSLPKFDFVLMNSTSKPPVSTLTKPTIVEKKETQRAKVDGYTFSEPLVISKDLKSVAAINCFKFSEPLSTTKPAGIKLKNNGENVNLLEKKIWECQTCLVKNDTKETKCCACDEPKQKEEKGFGEQFKLSSDRWECNSCLVRNNKSDNTCVACSASKPATGDKPKESNKPIATFGFGDKFKPPVSTWECNSCLIRNKNELTNCAACGTPKTATSPAVSSFGDKFKPSNDTWECSTCMIRNKNDVDKCAACETPKPGAKPVNVGFNTSGTKFSFGIKNEWECKTCMIKNKNELTKCAACETPKETGFGDAFKKKNDEWECSSCMVRNKGDSDACVCCGVPKKGEKVAQIETKEVKPVNSFNFGIDKAGATQFKFGIPATKAESTSAPTTAFGDVAKTVAPTTFTFGISTQEKTVTSTSEPVKSNPLLKPEEKLPQKATPAPVGFKFGLDNSLNKNQVSESVVSSKTETTTATTSSFVMTPAIPTFQFKPATVNGEVNKASDAKSALSELNKTKEKNDKQTESPKFSTKPDSSPFTTGVKATESPFTMAVKPTESPFSTAAKSTESPFSSGTKKTESLFTGGIKTTESLFTASPKTSESLFSGGTKTTESSFSSGTKITGSHFGVDVKTSESPFGGGTKPTESPFATASPKLGESPFTSTNKTMVPPFGAVSKSDSPFAVSRKTTNSPFGTAMSKPNDSPFHAVSKPIESPFAKPNKPIESPFGTGKPSDSPFTSTSELPKPKESLFGTPNSTPKPIFEAPKTEPIFEKPKEVLFGTKPPEGSNLFSTPSFSFAKPSENTVSAFSPQAPVFKFGADASQPKPALGETDTNISNGFGIGAKIPAFGTSVPFGTSENKTQPFGSTDNKPQPFGSTENKLPVFGAAEPKPLAFGAPEPKPPAFGTTETKPFSFEPPKSSGFSFGQTEKPNTAAPIFNFGSSAAAVQQPSGGFNFSVPNTGFNFGGGAKVENQQPFGAAPSGGNVFGSGGTGAKNGSFNFGTNANNNNQKAVFSFGANQTSQPSQPSFPTQSQGGFNFGPSAPMNVPPPGAFNFTGAPPTFNFTDGNSSQNQPPRKFKKALRRTTHR